MQRISFHEGVWFNGAAAVLAGAGAVRTVTATDKVGLFLGWAGIVLGIGLVIWGFKIDGEHWWRLRFVEKRRDNMNPYQLWLYLNHESDWGWWRMEHVSDPSPTGVAPPVPKSPETDAFSEFRRVAQIAGSPVRVFGQRPGSSESEYIRHTFWMTNGIHPNAIIPVAGFNRTVPTGSAESEGYVGYESLSFDGASIRRAWPRRNAMKRWRTKRREIEFAEKALADAQSKSE